MQPRRNFLMTAIASATGLITGKATAKASTPEQVTPGFNYEDIGLRYWQLLWAAAPSLAEFMHFNNVRKAALHFGVPDRDEFVIRFNLKFPTDVLPQEVWDAGLVKGTGDYRDWHYIDLQYPDEGVANRYAYLGKQLAVSRPVVKNDLGEWRPVSETDSLNKDGMALWRPIKAGDLTRNQLILLAPNAYKYTIGMGEIDKHRQVMSCLTRIARGGVRETLGMFTVGEEKKRFLLLNKDWCLDHELGNVLVYNSMELYDGSAVL